ncbi:MAG: hypothetical protein N3D84_03660, partial [Candidatus Woesearchaeota archaeon]|nr:hypothetical protein [Candidatus Woesearchaeota archaeon]
SRDMILASVLIMLAAISKYDFLVIGMPMLFIFPWKRLNELRRLSKKYVPYAISFLIFMLIPVQYFYFDYINRKANVGSISEEINFATIFSSEFWAAMKSYIPDNYTWWGFAIALFGVAFLLLFYQKNNLGYRFSLGYLVGLFIYTFIMSDKMKGHSYHQYSLAPFFAIMIAYCLVVVATNAANIVKIKQAKPLIIIALFLVLYFPSAEAWNRQFDTQFFGLDVAGEYIKNNSMPYERIIHSNHQDYGVLWYAERKGVDGYIPNASEIRWAEENLNVTWIFMYQWGLQTIKQPDEWNYIKQHYSLKQLALLNGQLFYMLFKKGGSFNESMLQNITAVPSVREYELTKGKVQMHYINFD